MSWRISPSSGRLNFAPATNAWLAAVEAADGQLLENGVYNAMGAFGDYRIPLGGACCLMAGARTLAGALVPMVGAAPTEVNFVSEDYDRTTGLKGDGIGKYLDSNRNNNVDPRDSNHNALYITFFSGGTQVYMGADSPTNSAGTNNIGRTYNLFFRNRSTGTAYATPPSLPSLVGTSRAASGSYIYRAGGMSQPYANTSQIPFNGSITIFASGGTGFRSSSRISFYSIGPSVDLDAMDTAITTCMNALAAAGI